jgi:hypothetical protein
MRGSERALPLGLLPPIASHHGTKAITSCSALAFCDEELASAPPQLCTDTSMVCSASCASRACEKPCCGVMFFALHLPHPRNGCR